MKNEDDEREANKSQRLLNVELVLMQKFKRSAATVFESNTMIINSLIFSLTGNKLSSQQGERERDEKSYKFSNLTLLVQESNLQRS